MEGALLRSLCAAFTLRPEALDPLSTWFSYGSNLNITGFAAKMRNLKGAKSNLTIQNPRVAALPGYRRRLGNESSSRCISYTISKKPGSHVVGILHDVPIDELAQFLTMEGVVDGALRPEEGEVRRAYDIIKVLVLCTGALLEALSLEGRTPKSIESEPKDDLVCKEKLKAYVEEAKGGAEEFRIDTRLFSDDLAQVEDHFR